MNDRLKTMQRIVRLQAQQKRLAEWRLAATEQRKAEIEAAQRELAGFADGGDLTGRLAGEALLQSQRLARQASQAALQRETQAGAVRDAERRFKLSERAAERLGAEARANAERRALETLLDTMAARGIPDTT